ncbi:MAG: PTS sugar transporter subunit IIA [Propioniciclava sp.]
MKILLVGHAEFPQGLLSAARMIVGDRATAAVVAIGLTDLAMFKAEVTEALTGATGVLVLADLMGGSPCNTVLEVARELDIVPQIRVITGANLGLLIEFALARKEPTTGEVITRAAPRELTLAPNDDEDEAL